MFDEHDDSIAGQMLRVILKRVNDSGAQQVASAEGVLGQIIGEAVRIQHYGYTNVPPVDSEGHFATPGGRFDRGVLHGLEHPQSRVKNLKPGESAHYDDQKQVMKIARDGYYATAKQHVVTAGDQPDATCELNEQLKGLAARMAQAEHNLHGLFDVTSRFRDIVQQQIPAVEAVADILNADPSTGLQNMADAIEGKVQQYLQAQVQQALAKFLNPNIAGLSSLLAGGVEGLIGTLKSEIAQILDQNPVVALVDGLIGELAEVNASGAEASVITDRAAELAASIQALSATSPAVGQIAQLRQSLQDLLDSAGPGLNFLAPQKRLVQGVSKSLHLSDVG